MWGATTGGVDVDTEAGANVILILTQQIRINFLGAGDKGINHRRSLFFIYPILLYSH